MKSKYMFEKMELDGQIMAVPVGENAKELPAVLNLNEVAMRILELLQEETTETKITEQLKKEYDGTEEEISSAVHVYVERLRREGFLVE